MILLKKNSNYLICQKNIKVTFKNGVYVYKLQFYKIVKICIF